MITFLRRIKNGNKNNHIELHVIEIIEYNIWINIYSQLIVHYTSLTQRSIKFNSFHFFDIDKQNTFDKFLVKHEPNKCQMIEIDKENFQRAHTHNSHGIFTVNRLICSNLWWNVHFIYTLCVYINDRNSRNVENSSIWMAPKWTILLKKDIFWFKYIYFVFLFSTLLLPSKNTQMHK